MDWLQREMGVRGIDWAPPDRDANDEQWLRACELELPAGLRDATRANAIAETGPEVFFQHLAVPGCETIAAECTGMAL